MSFVFENVSKQFLNQNESTLQRINLEIQTGEFVCIVGKSGCGKSTLIKLIQGFYPVENGKIKILGKDINEYSLAELRNVLTYVPQDSYLFEGTIAENIAFGWNEETAPVMDVIVSAAKKAHADEFIKDLPEGSCGWDKSVWWSASKNINCKSIYERSTYCFDG